MILDNSGIDYARMLFVFGLLVFWKIFPKSCSLSRFRQHLLDSCYYKAVASILSKKKKM